MKNLISVLAICMSLASVAASAANSTQPGTCSLHFGKWHCTGSAGYIAESACKVTTGTDNGGACNTNPDGTTTCVCVISRSLKLSPARSLKFHQAVSPGN